VDTAIKAAMSVTGNESSSITFHLMSK